MPPSRSAIRERKPNTSGAPTPRRRAPAAPGRAQDAAVPVLSLADRPHQGIAVGRSSAGPRASGRPAPRPARAAPGTAPIVVATKSVRPPPAAVGFHHVCPRRAHNLKYPDPGHRRTRLLVGCIFRSRPKDSAVKRHIPWVARRRPSWPAAVRVSPWWERAPGTTASGDGSKGSGGSRWSGIRRASPRPC